MENEFLPIISGAVAGLLLGTLSARHRALAWVLLSVGLGMLATVASGEFRTTWAYLLIDIPLVATASLATFHVSRRVRRRSLGLA